jgi:hypothetical protein
MKVTGLAIFGNTPETKKKIKADNKDRPLVLRNYYPFL